MVRVGPWLRRQGAPTTAPAIGTGLRAQLVIRGHYPYGPGWQPSDGLLLRENQPFFTNLLGQVYLRDKPLADRILREYVARGLNDICMGPAVAMGYHHEYPDVDWRGQVEKVVEIATWLRASVPSITLVALPDVHPYFLGTHEGWDMDLVERDLNPIYRDPRVQAAVSRVRSCWEIWVSVANFRRPFQWLAETFPTQQRFWHNPPGHLSPGDGGIDEEATSWRECLKYCHGMQFQADRPGTAESHGRSDKMQLVYNLLDMQRRFLFGSSPACDPANAPPGMVAQWESVQGTDPKGFCAWNGDWPTTNCAGEPVALEYAEGAAAAIYNDGYPESVALEWGQEALTVHGVVNLGDGGPPATAHG